MRNMGGAIGWGVLSIFEKILKVFLEDGGKWLTFWR